MTVKTIMLMLVFLCSMLTFGSVNSTVTAKAKIGLAYDQISLVVTVDNPSDVTAVKVVLKGGQEPDREERAVLSGKMASVSFLGLTPGVVYSCDVLLLEGETEVVPLGWKTMPVNLFSDVDWFGFETGAFRMATADANIEIKEQAYVSKDDALGVVSPTVLSVDGAETLSETRVEVKGAYDWSDLPSEEDVQIAVGLVLKENAIVDIPENRVWAYKVGSEGWTALASSDAPVTNGIYNVRTILDYRTGQKKASCTLMAGSSSYTLLQDVPLTAVRMNRFGIIGGSVNLQDVRYPHVTSPVEVQPTGTQIELASSGEVDLAKLTEDASYTVTDHGYALCWKDTANRYATKSGNTLTLHTGTPANGLESFASHALGLNPTVTLDKPAAVVKEGGMQSATGVTVHVPNVVKGNLPDAGVTVVHRLQRSDDKGRTWTDTDTEVGAGESLVVPFESGVLYRVNTVLK